MWGSIISAGASLLGGLFGKKKEKVTNEVDYVKMAQNATAAGFNPLTAIRNGGSAGFTTTSSPTASLLPQVLGNLGGALGDAFDRKSDAIAAARRPDTSLVDQQLRKAASGGTGRGPKLYGGGTYSGVKVTTNGVPTPAARHSVPQVAPRASSGPPKAAYFATPDLAKFAKPDPVKPIPLWIPGIDRDGKVIHIANPDGPDLEQTANAYMQRSISGYEGMANAMINWRGQTTVRKLKDAERRKQTGGWRDWLPSFDIKWDK